ncbi:hypothetical protein IW152_002060 [Coemansia sp. BCRC 34962]|nr:hypothetical protein IW152_002060 [Coemansia sp. BCRC 34962]
MSASTVSAEYKNATDPSSTFVMAESASGNNLVGALEHTQGQLNAKLTAMMSAEKNNQEPETPHSSADEDNDSMND